MYHSSLKPNIYQRDCQLIPYGKSLERVYIILMRSALFHTYVAEEG